MLCDFYKFSISIRNFLSSKALKWYEARHKKYNLGDQILYPSVLKNDIFSVFEISSKSFFSTLTQIWIFEICSDDEPTHRPSKKRKDLESSEEEEVNHNRKSRRSRRIRKRHRPKKARIEEDDDTKINLRSSSDEREPIKFEEHDLVDLATKLKVVKMARFYANQKLWKNNQNLANFQKTYRKMFKLSWKSPSLFLKILKISQKSEIFLKILKLWQFCENLIIVWKFLENFEIMQISDKFRNYGNFQKILIITWKFLTYGNFLKLLYIIWNFKISISKYIWQEKKWKFSESSETFLTKINIILISW